MKFKVEWKEILIDTRVATFEANSKQQAINLVKALKIQGYSPDDYPAQFVKIVNGSIKAKEIR